MWAQVPILSKLQQWSLGLSLCISFFYSIVKVLKHLALLTICWSIIKQNLFGGYWLLIVPSNTNQNWLNVVIHFDGIKRDVVSGGGRLQFLMLFLPPLSPLFLSLFFPLCFLALPQLTFPFSQDWLVPLLSCSQLL